jgi:hypothetical protein
MTQKSNAKADASENDRKPRAAPKPRPLRDVDARALEEFKARQQKKPPMEEISLRDLGFDESGVAHAANAFMSGDPTFTVGLCQQLQHVASAGMPFPIDRMNFMLSLIKGIEPRDPTEALHASQMAAVHCALMACSRRSTNALLNQRVDAEHNTMIRLSRTFAAQMEALKRYRSTGEQSIRVQHQHVNVNAQQAVVGINQEGEGGQENRSQPHEPNRPHEPSDLVPVAGGLLSWLVSAACRARNRGDSDLANRLYRDGRRPILPRMQLKRSVRLVG